MNEQLSLIQRFRKTVIGEYAEALIWAVALALVLTTFVVQAFKIPSGSMLETLQIGDHLLVNKFLYGLRNPFNDDYLIRGVEPKVGDIIVFRYPKDRSLDYIKRIVGVPGDTLEMRNKVLYRNGVEVQEPYTQHSQPLIMIPGRDNWPQSKPLFADDFTVVCSASVTSSVPASVAGCCVVFPRTLCTEFPVLLLRLLFCLCCCEVDESLLSSSELESD